LNEKPQENPENGSLAASLKTRLQAKLPKARKTYSVGEGGYSGIFHFTFLLAYFKMLLCPETSHPI
jgi:hypothetical protein